MWPGLGKSAMYVHCIILRNTNYFEKYYIILISNITKCEHGGFSNRASKLLISMCKWMIQQLLIPECDGLKRNLALVGNWVLTCYFLCM